MSKFQNILTHRSDDLDFWVGRDAHHKEWLIEAFLKVEGGVRHLVRRVKQDPHLDQIRVMAREAGTFSARPYQLAQACDGSISAPVNALYHLFCEARGIDTDAVYLRAYPHLKAATGKRVRDATLAFGHWQGIAVPQVWGDAEAEGLLESLREVNASSLASALEDELELRCAAADAEGERPLAPRG